MIFGIELLVLVLAIVVIIAAVYLLKKVKELVINSIIGLIIIFVVNYLGLVSVSISWVVILIIALLGIPGVLVVLLLAYLEVAFYPGVVFLESLLLP